jgi:hypothetical protein
VKALKNHVFAALWLTVIGVSVYDGYWVLANRAWINTTERNPVGRLLLHWNAGDVWLLLAVKALGTLLAAVVLLVLYWTWPRIGWIACSATAVFQFGLFLFLYLPSQTWAALIGPVH